jgi:hypothetical protein
LPLLSFPVISFETQRPPVLLLQHPTDSKRQVSAEFSLGGPVQILGPAGVQRQTSLHSFRYQTLRLYLDRAETIEQWKMCEGVRPEASMASRQRAAGQSLAEEEEAADGGTQGARIRRPRGWTAVAFIIGLSRHFQLIHANADRCFCIFQGFETNFSKGRRG